MCKVYGLSGYNVLLLKKYYFDFLRSTLKVFVQLKLQNLVKDASLRFNFFRVDGKSCFEDVSCSLRSTLIGLTICGVPLRKLKYKT